MADDKEDDFFDDAEDIIDETEFEAEGWDEIPSDPEEASKILSALEGIVPDILKKTISAGVGGLSTSEERLRSILSEKQLPKEVVAYILKQVDTTKREFYRIVSKEVRDFLEDVDLGGELSKILTSLSLEANVQVRFVPNEESVNKDSVKPKASGKVRVKKSEESGEGKGGSSKKSTSDKKGSSTKGKGAEEADDDEEGEEES